jgi:hypothetical protein
VKIELEARNAALIVAEHQNKKGIKDCTFNEPKPDSMLTLFRRERIYRASTPVMYKTARRVEKLEVEQP